MTIHSEFSKCLFRKSAQIQYEVPFPTYQKTVIGLVTVKPKITPPILKGIHTIQLTASLLDMAATQCLLKRK
jgi:hypothetical protein